jgi:hypothetical protein
MIMAHPALLSLTCFSRLRLAENPAPAVAKDKREPKWRPRGQAKPVFIPKWKQVKLDAMPADARAKALDAFKQRWFPAAA